MTQRKLARKLKAARLAHRYSQRDVAALTHHQVSDPYLSQIEQGRIAEPSPLKLKHIARVLRLDYVNLLYLAGYLTFAEKESLQ